LINGMLNFLSTCKDFNTDFYQLKIGLNIIKWILSLEIPLSKLQRFANG
jgi:hypothetical protein